MSDVSAPAASEAAAPAPASQAAPSTPALDRATAAVPTGSGDRPLVPALAATSGCSGGPAGRRGGYCNCYFLCAYEF